ncbi:MAG: PPOX class F420-dependent oxidoreductase [Chloroflexi bacterium]|nr:PPOX class F420-dependent oxidoreductase [Chloroflexota bacterium]
MDVLDQFSRQQYLNLETFRRSGESMKTPVWFVQEGKTLYVSTMANSGKVKRIRNNGGVNVAACKMNGKVSGAWVPARACEITDPEIGTKVNRMLEKKYGLMKKLFDRQRTQKGAKDTLLEIKLIE